jgi:hypothetical protein
MRFLQLVSLSWVQALSGRPAPSTRPPDLTGLSRDLLYDQMRRSNLAYIKVGRYRLITRQHLQRIAEDKPWPRART